MQPWLRFDMNSSVLDWLGLLLKRDLIIAFRRSSTYITPLVFFLIVITFFPLALGPQESLLSSLAPGVIWIAALLASLLAVESIFSEDFRDGSLDDFFISLEPSFVLVFAKVMIHWLITGLPILLASSLAAIILYLPLDKIAQSTRGIEELNIPANTANNTSIRDLTNQVIEEIRRRNRQEERR